MVFQDFGLDQAIIQGIEAQDYQEPTPIQKQAIPVLLKGRDLVGCAQTGTGKTAAFAIPILQNLLKEDRQGNQEDKKQVRALVLAPTRELAIQIGEQFEHYGAHLDMKVGVIFGGVTPKRHIKVLKREPEILVATPGRLVDLVQQGFVKLERVGIFVLDEADQMLDVGMIKQVKTVIAQLPKKRQNILFSATMPKEVTKLAHTLLKNPVQVEAEKSPDGEIQVKQQVYFVEEPDKTERLLQFLKTEAFESILIFTRTKKKADKVSKAINVANIRNKAIHGDKNQSERQKVLELFKQKEIKILVATDIAARGIDIDKLSHVINMDIPNVPETYIHRIGRTGRAGQSGTAISFCSEDEREWLKAIEKLQGKSLEVMNENLL
ncbi:DEAD/DEAH box helicase [Niameybacter massiliensis]|uniref:DEAD/DEAH box helicase n=1 Tax=Holtiella tumoricola TaxID=3018743 RepID=A0AA42J0J5_9FIRM|nr:DEAD/DEAH box helicase [Holtiella tumoricola]MDA3731464.1 DEAD/DEAH box helicase [Holtiella tumoricola]